jgi:uncharacterized protein YjiS (DUF1127 family)
MLHCSKAPGALRRDDGVPDPVPIGMRPMTAQITKDQFNHSLGNVSYVDYSVDEPPARVIEIPTLGIGKFLHRMLTAVADWRRRQTVIREMEMLTDRDLADIGLTRSDLPRVFDPEFAADHAHGRDYIAY